MFYRTGTISLTNGSTAVTGAGTDFISGAAVGECVSAPDGKLYEILSIQSATALTLGQVYLGSTASGQSYSIVPTQSYIRDLASQAATLVNDYSSVATGAGSGKFGDGTQAIPGVRFTADEDTGIRRTGANSMALVAAGADQLLVDANGVTVTAAAKTTPADADSVMLVDSAASSILKKLTWANLKAALAAWINGGTIPGNFTAITGPHNGTVGATTPATGAFTTLSSSGNTTLGDATGDTVAIQAGTAALPALIPSGDPNTGLWFPAADTVAVSTAGSEKVRINSSGNVGIGTTPTTKLHVSVAGTVVGRFENASASIALQIGANSTAGFVGTSTNHALLLSTNDVERLRINSSGNVGVGTNAPDAALKVSRTDATAYTTTGSAAWPITTTSSAHVIDNQASLDASASYLGFAVKNTVAGVQLAYMAAIAAVGSNGANLVFGRRTGSTTYAESMRIDPLGQVGIGLTPTTRNNTRLQIIDGIGFPATQVASSDPNTLDDYEEGTFTPTIIGTTVAGEGTYSTQLGRYTKIGRIVTVNISLVWSAHTGTGNMKIAGLPFTSTNTGTGMNWGCAPQFVNMTMPASSVPFASIYINSAVIDLMSVSITNAATTALAMDTGASVYLSITYESN